MIILALLTGIYLASAWAFFAYLTAQDVHPESKPRRALAALVWPWTWWAGARRERLADPSERSRLLNWNPADDLVVVFWILVACGIALAWALIRDRGLP